MTPLLLLACLCLQQPTTAPADFDSVVLSTSDKHVLVIPRDARPVDGKVDLFVQLKGSPARVHSAMRENRINAIAIVVTDQGLSRAYSGPFSDPELLQKMIDESFEHLRQRSGFADVAPGRLSIGSFSAGYAAVRELLKHDRWFDRIDGLYFQDSIYAGYVSENDKSIPPEQMAGFIRFARAAAEGKKTMILTHTKLTPGSYASTYETADAILDALKLEAQPIDPPVEIAAGLLKYREAKRFGFTLIGTSGDDGAEHGRHLMNMNLFLGQLPLSKHAD
jgi:hypothetical protein